MAAENDNKLRSCMYDVRGTQRKRFKGPATHKKEAEIIQTGRKKVIRKHNNRPKHVNGDMIEFKR